MSIDTIRTAVAALEAAGTDVSIRTLQEALPGVGRSTIGRHLAIIRAERGEEPSPGAAVGTAVLEPPSVPDNAPDTAQGVQQAQAAVDAAKARLVAAERSSALSMRLSLVSAQRQGIITRADPVWRDFDDATRLVASATEEVEQAEKDLQAAQRRHLSRLRAEAEETYSVTEKGKAALAEIARLQRLYDDAAAKELGSVASYSHALGLERHAFQEGVSKVLATMQPAEPPAPSGPPARLTPEMLRGCYVHGDIGRTLPPGITRFEVEDYPALVQFREALREELAEAYRVYRDLEGDEAMSAAAAYDPRTLPLRQAKHKTGILHSAVQLIDTDIKNLQRRANDSGQYL